MSRCFSLITHTLILLASLSVVACGGGGGGDSSTSPPIVNISSNSITEGDSGSVDLIFTIALSKNSDSNVSVDFITSDGTATAGSDYIANSGSVTIPAGSTSATATVSIIGDTTSEIDETFTVTLSNVSGNAVLGANTATGTIINDDIPQLSIADSQVDEGDIGDTNLTFTISLSGPTNGNVNVDYATSDGTATTSNSDYTAASGTAIIPAGAVSTDITVLVSGDNIVEPDETLNLTLSNISANATLGVASAIGTITNDDVDQGLNDTGITFCADDLNNNLACNDSSVGTDQYPGQDAEYGRDNIFNNDANGHAGFSFTKLDASGVPLPNQDLDYATQPWSCVLDNVTDLMWETKTDNGGLRDKDWTYTWYNSTGSNDGGDPGTADTGPTIGSDNCFDNSRCDTEKYVADINALGLCGHNDWRLPTRQELQSIVNYNVPEPGPTIDTGWFPNTPNNYYWSSSPYALSSLQAWLVNVLFGGGVADVKSADANVRLVRDYP